MMKKIQVILIALTLGLFSLTASESWGEIPFSFIDSNFQEVTDSDTETFADVKSESVSFEFSSSRVQKLLSISALIEGDVIITVYDSSLNIILLEEISQEKGLYHLSFPADQINDTIGYTYEFTSNTIDGLANVYEISAFGFCNTSPFSQITIDASNDTVILETPELESGLHYQLELNFTDEEISGIVTIGDGLEYQFEYMIHLPTYEEKHVTLEYLPISTGDYTISFAPTKGSLQSATLLVVYPTGEDDFQYINEQKLKGKQSTAWNVYDQSIQSEYISEWDSNRDGTLNISMIKPVDHVYVAFYWNPGLSQSITFEALVDVTDDEQEPKSGDDYYCEDDDQDRKTKFEYITLGTMDSDSIITDGITTRTKAEWEYLRFAGWKVFDTGISDRKIRDIRIVMKDSATAGGISEVELFTQNAHWDDYKLLIPKSGGTYIQNSPVYLYSTALHDVIELEKKNKGFHQGQKKTGIRAYLTKIYDIVKHKIFRYNTARWIIPFTTIEEHGVVLDLPNNNVFAESKIEISGESTLYPVKDLRINNKKIKPDKKGKKHKKKGTDDTTFSLSLPFKTDGIKYLISEITGRNKKKDKTPVQKRIDPIYIDTQAPRIILDYPQGDTVTSINSPIRGFIYDLTPYRVEINDVPCIMDGRWFSLNDATVDEENKEYLIVAWDKAGHRTEKTIYLTVDDTAPVLEILSPADNTGLNTVTVTIEAKVSDTGPVTVYCNGEVFSFAAGTHEFSINDVPLQPGENLITLIAVDEAENKTEKTLRVGVDTTAPVITGVNDLYYSAVTPVDIFVQVKDTFSAQLQYGLNQSYIDAELISESVINGMWVGTFIINPNIFTGSNVVILKAIDSVGNKTTRSIEVILDTQEPVIEITEPDEQLYTSQDTITVRGTYIEEYLDKITVNGLDAVCTNGVFITTNVPLIQEGTNDVTVTALDLAGNESMHTVFVNKDTIPPQSSDVTAHTMSDITIDVHWQTNTDSIYTEIIRTPPFTSGESIITEYSKLRDEDNIDYSEHPLYVYQVRKIDRAGNKSEWKTATIGAQKQFVPSTSDNIEYDGMTLSWDGNELDSTTDITVYSISYPELIDDGTFYSPLYSLLPNYQTFNDPLIISMDLSHDVYNMDDVKWYVYNEDDQMWSAIRTEYDQETGKLIGYIEHFSTYAAKQDTAREYTDSDLSALKSTRQDTNVHIVESKGSAIFAESELTLKGPGQYDYTLQRTLDSNTLAGKTFVYQGGNFPDYESFKLRHVGPSYTDPTAPSFDSYYQKVFYNTPSHNHDLLLDIGSWSWNIPHIRGSRVIFEDGSSLDLGSIPVNTEKIIFDEFQYFEVSTSEPYPVSMPSNFYTETGTEVDEYYYVDIAIKTLSGKIYNFSIPSVIYAVLLTPDPFNPGFKYIKGGTRQINKNIKSGEYKNIVFYEKFVRIANNVTYPDGNTLNFGQQTDQDYYGPNGWSHPSNFRIYWNNNIENALVIFRDYGLGSSSVENLVSGDKVEYHFETFEESIPLRSGSSTPRRFWKYAYIKDATYTNTRDAEKSYTILYDTDAFEKTVLIRGKKNINDAEEKAPPTYHFSIVYPDGKKRKYLFKRWYKHISGPMFFGLMKRSAYLDSMSLYKNNGTTLFSQKKYRYVGYDSQTPKCYSSEVSIQTTTYGLFNSNGFYSTNDINTIEYKQFSPSGKLVYSENEQQSQSLSYNGFIGYVKMTSDEFSYYSYNESSNKFEQHYAGKSGTVDIGKNTVTFDIGDATTWYSYDWLYGCVLLGKVESAHHSTWEFWNYNISIKNEKNHAQFKHYEGSHSDSVIVRKSGANSHSYSYDRFSRSQSSFYKTQNGVRTATSYVDFLVYRDEYGNSVYASFVPKERQVGDDLFYHSRSVDIFLYFYNTGIAKDKIKTTSSQMIDENKTKGNTSWSEYNYDSYGRQNVMFDSLGNYKQIIYKDNDLVKTNPEREETYLLDYPGTKNIDDKVLLNTIDYLYDDYSVNEGNYIRLSNKTVSDRNGAVKNEQYSYYSAGNLRKLDQITAYEVENGTVSGDVKNRIKFEYDSGKKDYPLSRVAILDSDSTELFTRDYDYEEGSGLMNRVNDSYGNQTDFEYDYLGRNDKITFVNDSVVQYQFNDVMQNGNLANYSRAIYENASDVGSADYLQKERLEYYNNNIYKIDYYKENDTSINQTFTYDALGRKRSSTDFKGNVYHFDYTKLFLKTVKKPAVDTIRPESNYSYSIATLQGKKYLLTRVFDEEGKETRQYRDQWGRTVFSGVLLNGEWRGTYIVYDHRSKPVTQFAGALMTGSGFDISGCYETQFEYDDLGRLIRKIAVNIEIELSGTTVNVIEEYEYDEFDFLIKKYTYSDGTTKTDYQWIEYKYDGAGNQTQIIEHPGDGSDPLETDVVYDNNGNIVEVIYPPIDTDTQANYRMKTWYVYDSMGRVRQVISNPGESDIEKVTFYEYDKMGRRVGTYDMRASGGTASESSLEWWSGYDGGRTVYNLTTDEVTKSNFGTTVTYDKLGRVTKVTYPKNLEETAVYDNNGNLLSVTNRNEGQTWYRYDELNRLILEKSGDTVTFHTYYKNGQKKAFVLPNAVDESTREKDIDSSESAIISELKVLSTDTSKTVQYEYNSAGMLYKGTDCYGNYVQYTYTQLGQVLTKRLKTGAVQEFEYFNGGLTKRLTLTDNGDSLQKQKFDYTWWGAQKAYYTGEKNNPVKSFKYNTRKLLEKVTDTYGNQRTVEYNNLGMATDTTYPDDRIEALTYNRDGQLVNDTITADELEYIRTFEYDRISGAVTQANVTEKDDSVTTDSLTEDFTYDMWGTIYDYAITASGTNTWDSTKPTYTASYNSRYLKDVEHNREYLSYPGAPDQYMEYKRDEYARLTSLGSENNPVGSFTYKTGNIDKIEWFSGSGTDYTTQFVYDLFGRVTDSQTTSDGINAFHLTNEYENVTGNRTGNLKHQIVKTGVDADKTFDYSYDKALRINYYAYSGLEVLHDLLSEEERRSLQRNVYAVNPDLVDTDNFWLKPDHEKMDGGNPLPGYEDEIGYSIHDAVDDTTVITIDRDQSTIEVTFNMTTENIQWISIPNPGDDTTYDINPLMTRTGWYTIGYRIDDSSAFTLIPQDGYTTKREVGREIITLNDAISAKSLRLILHRNDMNPFPYASVNDATNDEINRLNEGYKETTTSLMTTTISNSIRVYTYRTQLTGTMAFDSADRRTLLSENGAPVNNINFDNNGLEDRIKRQGDTTYYYDNAGRRVGASSPGGTYIYRYNLDGRLTRAYYAGTMITDDSFFDNFNNITDINDDYNADFTLIEVNRYNVSGIRIYKWSMQEESVYYQTPFGYLGKKNIREDESRYLVNYINSSGAATYSFESAQGNYNQAEGSIYSSKMNLYSGEQHGIERAAMNNKVPVAVDMQPLFETTFADVTTDTVTPLIYDFDGTAIYTSITIVDVMQKKDVLLYHRDQIGSIRAVTTLGENDIPEVVWSADYKPFGELLTNDLDTKWMPLKDFALHETDHETNLIYAQQRWLCYETGQFTSEDPIMDGLNWYAYAGGNPMGVVDPSGLLNVGDMQDTLKQVGDIAKVVGTTTVAVGAAIKGALILTVASVLLTPAPYSSIKIGDFEIKHITLIRLEREQEQRKIDIDSNKDALTVEEHTLDQSSPEVQSHKIASENSKSRNKELSDSGGKKFSKNEIKNLRRKAVRKAWKQEKELVKETTRGSRRWTDEQKEELLENGKVKGFDGHHINSVSKSKADGNTKLISNPNNIKFLTRWEHFKEHMGNWKNKTEGDLIDRKQIQKDTKNKKSETKEKSYSKYSTGDDSDSGEGSDSDNVMAN